MLIWRDIDGIWHAEIQDVKVMKFYVLNYVEGWGFRYHGPDGMSPPQTNFDDYRFRKAADAKDAALLHYQWLGDGYPHHFDRWYENYRQTAD
jgi:hypothetical protein